MSAVAFPEIACVILHSRNDYAYYERHEEAPTFLLRELHKFSVPSLATDEFAYRVAYDTLFMRGEDPGYSILSPPWLAYSEFRIFHPLYTVVFS